MSELDKSIDIGMNQFGRFVRLRWFWLILASFVVWYTIVYIVPQLSPPSPMLIFSFAFQIAFTLFIVVFQFVAIFWFLGRPRLYWVMPGETGLTFKDYVGNPGVLEEARRIVTILRGVQDFKEMGGKPVRGLLLSGPPGTGKSYLAQCISTEAGVPFAYASAASFKAMFIGMDVLMVKRLYGKARKLAREYGSCVIFMDEFDAIGMSRGGGNQGQASMMGGFFGFGGTGSLNELLMQMDPPPVETGWFKKILRLLGLYHERAQEQPVLTIGATNIPQSLDPALLRPGRFDRQIKVLPPTDKYRAEVIEYYLKKVKHDPKISIKALVQRMPEYTPVAIKHVINEAVIIAHFNGHEYVTYRDITEAQDTHEFGLRQESDLTAIERRRLAYHEAGHTVACYYVMDRHFPAYVTLHRHTGEEGAEAFAAWRAKETVKTSNSQEVLARIKVALASRAAEEIILDLNLNGVGGDLMSATTYAAAYVGAWGMDGTYTSAFAIREMQFPGLGVSRISERVEEVLQQQYREVKQLLQDHREALIAVAEALIDHNELVADEIKELIDEADARVAARRVLEKFEPLATHNGNGHNGLALAGSNGNGSKSGTPSLPRPLASEESIQGAPGLPVFLDSREDNPYM